MNPAEILNYFIKNTETSEKKLRHIERLLLPSALENLDELVTYLKPRPKYLGPGIWLRALREIETREVSKESLKKQGEYE